MSTVGDDTFRLERPPVVGAEGLRVRVEIRADHPIGRGPQAALAHALDAAGWWVGIGDDGRVTVGMGTTAGPVSLAVGEPLAAGEWAEISARIPVRIDDRLEVSVRVPRGATPVVRSAVIGARLVPAPGPMVWGCRMLREGLAPQHPFLGLVTGVGAVTSPIGGETGAL